MRIAVIHKDDLPQFIKKLNGLEFTPNATFKRAFTTIERKMVYKERDEMEVSDQYLQPIPYIVMSVNTNPKEILIYQRSKNSGEKRLVDTWSMGIGGHIDYPERIFDALRREVKEELSLDISTFRLKYVGFIRDQTTPVSQVHLGIVFNYILSEKEKDFILKNDVNREFAQLKFVSKEELLDTQFESWSELLKMYIIKEVK